MSFEENVGRADMEKVVKSRAIEEKSKSEWDRAFISEAIKEWDESGQGDFAIFLKMKVLQGWNEMVRWN